MLEKSEIPQKSDPRVRRTRQMLQQALNDLMAEKSFLQITVQDITAKAGVNRATFYSHYVDKYDLLNSIIGEHFQKSLETKLPAEPVVTCTFLYSLIEVVHTYLSGFPGQCNAAHLHRDQGLMVQQVQIQLYKVLLEKINRSPIKSTAREVTPEVTAMTASWAIFGPVLQNAWGHGTGNGKKISSQQLMDQVMLVVRGILDAYLVLDEAVAGRDL